MSLASLVRSNLVASVTRCPAVSRTTRPLYKVDSTRLFSNKSATGSVHVLDNSAEFKKYVTESKGVAILDAFAEWCRPCKMMSPVIAKMAEEYQFARFYKFDVDKVPDLAQKLTIQAMPTFLVFKDGMLQQTIIGANLKALKNSVNSFRLGSDI